MLSDRLGKDFLLFDGAMGTRLQNRGLAAGALPEEWNILHPEIIVNIHRRYLEAGADFITTNTFGCNPIKTRGSSFGFEMMIRRAVENAKEARRKVNPDAYIALDIGPIGRMLEPLGPVSFDEAVKIISSQVQIGRRAGVDAVLLETMTDLYEVKAGILAVKETCDLPLFVTMTFGPDGRTLTGADPLAFVSLARGLGADMLGINCSLGPVEIRPIAQKILELSPIPVLIQPNAGMPQIVDGETEYPLSAEDFARRMKEFIPMGAEVLGSCCGSDPGFTAKLKEILPSSPVKRRHCLPVAAVGSGRTVTFEDEPVICGERLNPTGRKALAAALRDEKYREYAAEAARQRRAGARALDLNVGLPGIDEPTAMVRAVRRVQEVVNIPLLLDSSSPRALEKGCRYYNGIPVINSVNGKERVMDSIFPIAKKYGALVVGLTLRDKVPSDAGERVKIAGDIIKKAGEYGISSDRIIIDCLTLTASAAPGAAMQTLQAIREVKRIYKSPTLLGVSNISFGLPDRGLLNRAFLTMALEAGLDMPIINPMDGRLTDTVAAFRLLSGQDRDGSDYIAGRTNAPSTPKGTPAEFSPFDVIYKGLKEEAEKVFGRLLEKEKPLDIIDRVIIPALDRVGRDYEAGKLFLPRLMSSAETAKAAFERIKTSFDKSGGKGPVIICTVEGDVHDIGKNIVRVVLESYGWDVVDLGKDVPADSVVQARKKYKPVAIGLSALMTTTVPAMEKTVKALRKAGVTCPVWAGGAVMSEKIARDVGADYYTPDAMASVRLLESLFGKNQR